MHCCIQKSSTSKSAWYIANANRKITDVATGHRMHMKKSLVIQITEILHPSYAENHQFSLCVITSSCLSIIYVLVYSNTNIHIGPFMRSVSMKELCNCTMHHFYHLTLSSSWHLIRYVFPLDCHCLPNRLIVVPETNFSCCFLLCQHFVAVVAKTSPPASPLHWKSVDIICCDKHTNKLQTWRKCKCDKHTFVFWLPFSWSSLIFAKWTCHWHPLTRLNSIVISSSMQHFIAVFICM